MSTELWRNKLEMNFNHFLSCYSFNTLVTTTMLLRASQPEEESKRLIVIFHKNIIHIHMHITKTISLIYSSSFFWWYTVLLLFMLLCVSVSLNRIKIISNNTITVLPSNPTKLTAWKRKLISIQYVFFLRLAVMLEEMVWFFSRISDQYQDPFHCTVQNVIWNHFAIYYCVAFSLIAWVNCELRFSDRMTVKYAK